MTDPWLPTLVTADPQSGYELAVKLARMTVTMTQPDAAIRSRLRADYETDFHALIAASGECGNPFPDHCKGKWLLERFGLTEPTRPSVKMRWF